jgi:hypothetical protein
MIKKAAFVLALALSALCLFADDGSGGLIDGDSWAILVSAPVGWVWDNSSLRDQGILGLYYKEGQRFSPSKLHIYINPSPKVASGPNSLQEFVDADQSTFMSSDSGVLVKSLAPYSAGLGYRFVMRDFDDSTEGYYQALAYYEGETAFFVIVLACRSPEEREAERSSLIQLLDSFTYIRKE